VAVEPLQFGGFNNFSAITLNGYRESLMKVQNYLKLEKGFTLIELIIVMVILGILGLLGGAFISKGFQGFKATDNRVAIYEEGKLALVRMEREIHNAVPNAVDSGTLDGDPTDLRFGMIDEIAMRNVFGKYTETSPANTITDETAGLPGPPTISIISIYNRDWTDFTGLPLPQRRLYTVTNLVGAQMTLSKPITPPRSSPRQRYYAVDRAVRYYLSGTTLLRSHLAINAENVNFNTLPVQTGYPLARNIQPGSLQFSYSPATLTRNAVVTINFDITKGGEQVSFHKEVHIRNVP
jgi:MSHA biogenesis protein MshO